MSLDLYITGKTPIRHKGTGVYVRENGQNVELTVDEVKTRWFDADVKDTEYEDNVY